MSSRIKLEDSLVEAVTKMSEGNPGAVTVIMRMFKEGDKIDPQSFAGGFGAVMLLDTFRIYGSRIWMLYKDVCREDIVSTIAVLRACQLGLVSQDTLKEAVDDYGRGINVPELLELVKIELQEFGRQAA
jgi:hypothetical protein